MNKLILLGPPGSGKGTQSDLLRKKYDYFILSTGDLLREEMNSKTEFGESVEGFINKGLLVPDEIVTEFILTYIREKGLAEKKVVFDGFPRTIVQAEQLDETLEDLNSEIDGAVLINVVKDDIINRLSGRWICPECSSVFSVEHAGGKCPECGTKLIKRNDDNIETINKRIEVYNRQTEPLLDYYRSKGKLLEIEGSESREKVNRKISEVISE